MFKSKKFFLIILISILIFIVVPFSFAQDIDVNSTDKFDINDVSSDIIQYSDGDEVYINLEETNLTIDEGDAAEIHGDVHVDVFDGPYAFELNVQCSYDDADGVLRTYTTLHDGSDFTFDISNFEGLRARDTPYILAISVVQDDLYDDNLMNDFWWIDGVSDETVTLKINSINDSPVIPTTDTFTPKGQIHVSADGNDSADGSNSTPFATIQRALDENRILGGNYEIIVNNGVYSLEDRYTISNNVRITGRGKVTITNEGQNDLFFLTGTIIAEFDNLTITRGINSAISGSSTIGGSGNAGKVLNIFNCTFFDNYGLTGAIITYSKTTILNSTFIKNEATGYSGGFQGIISVRDGSLTINYCNFIDNVVRDNHPIIYSGGAKVNANYNFWGNNSGPLSTDLSENIALRNWIAVLPQIDSDVEFVTGDNYNITVGYKYTNDSVIFNDLNISMPNLNVDVEAKLGNVVPSNINISNNVNITYSSNLRGDEKVSVKLNGDNLSYIEFIVNAALGDRIYVSTEGNDLNIGTSEKPLRSIKTAILKNKALGGDKTIIIMPGEYNESDLEITDNLTLMAENENTVIINALNNGRILVVDSNVNITNITFKNGLVNESDEYLGCGGAIYHNSGNLTIKNCIFENNVALNGGAIAAKTDDLLSVYDSGFKSNSLSENSNEYSGAAIFSQSPIDINNSYFVENIAEDANGVIYLASDADIANSNFKSNKANKGGAIYVDADDAVINITKNIFIQNEALEGGAIYSGVSAVTLIENNTFENNNNSAIYLYGRISTFAVNNNSLTNNSIYVKAANADLKNNVIVGSKIILDGGYISSAILTLLKNETVKVENGSIQLNATLSDDTGNIIDGGKITFTSDGLDIGEADVIDGIATLSYYFNDGNYVISAKTDDFTVSQLNTGLLRVNVKNYWFIDDEEYETLAEAINVSKPGDVIKGLPGDYYVEEIQIGHRTRPAEPWVINKDFTVTSINDEPIVLHAVGENIFNIDYYSNVTCINIVFTGANNPDGWGGAIYSMGKNIINIQNCTFKDNFAYDGAAIHAWGKLIINNSVFIDNEVAVYGGAVFKDGDGDFILENSKFINNTAYTYAGALYTMGYSEINQIIRNVTFDGNEATCGGAFFTAGKNVTIVDCNFTNNNAIRKGSGYDPLGGAVFVHNGATKFVNVNFKNNYAQGNGGALQLDNAVTSIVSSAGRNITIHWAILDNCTIENNVAEGDGGAIYTSEFRTYVNITHSLIKNNTASNAALFVNLYSFYTLDNVTVEDNKNTECDSLIYTYGMFSIPESYYANTTIINCIFKNNLVDTVLKANNEYANVEIFDSTFDGVGTILTSLNANANLAGNIENNPINNYSINNNGNLTLNKNNFTNPILSTGVIDSPTYLIVMDNKTFISEFDENITLYSIILDDNENVIVGGNLKYVINNTLISAELENNKYVANYTIGAYYQIINAVYDDLGLLNLTTLTATVIGIEVPIINASDIEFNLTGKLEAYLLDKNSNPIANENVTVIIDKIQYNLITEDDGKVFVDLELPAGNYVAMIVYNGSDKYAPATINVTVTVNKLASYIDVEIGEAKVLMDIPIKVMLPDDAIGNVTVTVGNKTYELEVNDGLAKGNISDLSIGSYEVNVIYNGDDKYSKSNKSIPITTTKSESFVKVSVLDAVVGDDVIVNLNVPKDASGDVIVSVGGKDYVASVNDGNAVISVSGLTIGNYSVDAAYVGDLKYLDSENKTSFKVMDKSDDVSVYKNTLIELFIDNMNISGVLRDEDGNPVLGAVVGYVIDDISGGNVTTDGKGMFMVRGVEGKKITFHYLGNATESACVAVVTLNNVSGMAADSVRKATHIVVEKAFTRVATDFYAGERGGYHTAYLFDEDDNPVVNRTVQIAVNGPIYNLTTDGQGAVKLMINLNSAMIYTYALSFKGDDVYQGSPMASSKLTLTKKSTSISAAKKTFKTNAKTKTISVTLKTVKNPYDGKTYLKSGKSLTLKINGKTYTAKTNSKGVAKFSIKLNKKGKFIAAIKFAGDKTYKASSKKITITVK